MRDLNKEWQYYIQQACDAEKQVYDNATKMVAITLAVSAIAVCAALAVVLWCF